MNDQQKARHQQILSRLKDRDFTKNNQTQAAELDLERKVLENEGRTTRSYRPLWY
jgi:hypothetical protein